MPDETMPACPGADDPVDQLLDTTDVDHQPAEDREWHHLAIVHDGDSTRTYVDGVEK